MAADPVFAGFFHVIRLAAAGDPTQVHLSVGSQIIAVFSNVLPAL